MKDQELIDLLKQQAKEIADANIPGWGNTMTNAANRIEQLVSLQKTDITEGIKKSLEIISEVWKEIPLEYSYDEDARYNYPERENEVYKRLNSLLSN